jgi:isopentenyldiphosphate isomerase
MNEELVQLVDCNNQPCGTAPRSQVRANGLRHRATFLFVFSGDGRLFVQKRAASKDLYPSFYDACAGGVVRAGETYECNAIREAHEELGIDVDSPQGIADFLFERDKNRVWGRIFVFIHDGPFTFTDDEVEYGEFVELSELRAPSWQPLTPDSEYALELVLAQRRESLQG